MRRGILVYIGGRLLQSLLVLWAIATILFLLFRLAPGDPTVAFIDTTFSEEQEASVRARFGLDKSLPEQYVIYLSNLVQGDLGDSFFLSGKTVSEMIADALPNTLYLSMTSLILAYILGVIGGVVLAAIRGGVLERIGITITLMTRAAPEFWVGMFLLAIFAFELRWLPSSGTSSPGVIFSSEWEKLRSGDFWEHMILPMVTLTIYLQGLPLLLMRSNMLEILDQDFITMGRLVGYNNWRLLVRHAARNALLPVLTALTLGIGYSIGGNVVVENVFGWPGIGRMLVRAVTSSDYPVAQGAFFVIALIIVTLNFVADVLYSVLDPRVGASEQARLA